MSNRDYWSVVARSASTGTKQDLPPQSMQYNIKGYSTILQAHYTGPQWAWQCHTWAFIKHIFSYIWSHMFKSSSFHVQSSQCFCLYSTRPILLLGHKILPSNCKKSVPQKQSFIIGIFKMSGFRRRRHLVRTDCSVCVECIWESHGV